MNLLSPNEIKKLFEKYNARPSKGLGQNFLIDESVLDNIVESSDIKPNDIVLEVGPGLGVLTQELAKRAKKVIAVEKDKTMCEILKETLQDLNNIEVVCGDILTLDAKRYNLNSNYKIIANIPYYLTSPLIRKFLEADNPPQEMILMLQKEVAQRICASPPKMSLLAVSVQFYADAKIISYVSKNCFWPAPKIDSAIIKISRIHTNQEQIDTNLFFKIVKAGFLHPRKQLASNLSKGLEISKEKILEWLNKNKINPKQRAETLSVEDWRKLCITI